MGKHISYHQVNIYISICKHNLYQANMFHEEGLHFMKRVLCFYTNPLNSRRGQYMQISARKDSYKNSDSENSEKCYVSLLVTRQWNKYVTYVPRSMTSPSSRTKIWCAWMIVDSLCATMSVVRFSQTLANDVWMFLSVRVSRADVAWNGKIYQI